MKSRKTQPINVRTREVRAAIDRAQHRRQVMIFAVQVLFAVNLALVYIATSKITGRALLFTNAAALLMVYGMFAVWCVHRSSTRRLRWWDLGLSIILDFALLVGVVLQLGASGSQLAVQLHAAPLFSFVYLFIAIRCLHYEPAYVYFAGILGACVWLFMLVTAYAADAGKIVAIYQGFTLSGIILDGSVDKLATVAAVTLVLAACVKEARSHLYAAAIRGAAGKGLARMVGQNVAKEVLFSQHALVPGRGRHQTVAILMMDIGNFTKIVANADPSDVIAMLAHYQQIVEPVIVNNGGTIDKFMGDGIMAHFGAMQRSRTFAAQALKCVEELLVATDQWNAKRAASGYMPFNFRVACSIGEAVVGLVGGTTKVEFTIIGDPVNTTAKLEKHAKKLSARAVTTARAFNTAQAQGFRNRFGTRFIISEEIPGIALALDLVVMGEGVAKSQSKNLGRTIDVIATVRNTGKRRKTSRQKPLATTATRKIS